jgi:hypothetical protein
LEFAVQKFIFPMTQVVLGAAVASLLLSPGCAGGDTDPDEFGRDAGDDFEGIDDDEGQLGGFEGEGEGAGEGEGEGEGEGAGAESRVVVQTTGVNPVHLAEWTYNTGWRDVDGNTVDILPLRLAVDGRLLQLSAHFIYPNGHQVPMSTLEVGPPPALERTCSEYSLRYRVMQNNDVAMTSAVLAWPNVVHPAGALEMDHYAVRGSGAVVGIYNCETIHLYPEQRGIATIDFILWHGDHFDMRTLPLAIEVLPAGG